MRAEIEVRAPVEDVFRDPNLYRLFTEGLPRRESPYRQFLRGAFKITCAVTGFFTVLASVIPRDSDEYDGKTRALMSISGASLFAVGLRGVDFCEPCRTFRMVRNMFRQPFEEPGEEISRRTVVEMPNDV